MTCGATQPGLRRGLGGLLAALTSLTTACGGVLNPPPPPPTPTQFVPSTPRPRPATATPEPVVWVKNFRVTRMWSGPEGSPGVISFGETSSTFCSFRIDRPQDGPRIFVYNHHTDSHFWIDGIDVGPVEQPPPLRAGPKPTDVNCTEAIYDGRPVTPTPTPSATGTGTPGVTTTQTVTPGTGATQTATPSATGAPATSQTATPTPVLRP